MSKSVTVTLSVDDSAIVGATLSMLAHQHRCPDPSVAERLERVGAQLSAAAKLETQTQSRIS